MKFPALALLGLLTVSLVPAEVVFSGLDLDPQSRLLFSARSSDTPGGDYQVWFRSDLAAGTAPFPLTFFPETAAWLPGPGLLQIQNRFGVWRLDPATGALASVTPRVFGVDPGAGDGKSLPLAYSPDGRMVLAYQAAGAVRGSLVLKDVATSASTLVTEGVDLSFRGLPAQWSPDSQFFVYEKRGELFYYSLRQLREKRVPEENLRKIGPGLMASTAWGASGELQYVADQVLYRILPEEFFTRSLYRAQFQTWGVLGKLPFPFHPATDRFWLSPDGRAVLFNLGGRTLFYFPLEYLDFYQSTKLTPLTYLPLPQSLTLKRVLWAKDGRITLLASSLRAGVEETQVIRVAAAQVQSLDAGSKPVLDLALSPDEGQLLVVRRDGVSVRDAVTFAEKKFYPQDGVVAGFWKDAGSLLVTGRAATVKIALADGSVTPLLLGGLDQAGTVEGGRLAGRQGSQWYLWQATGAVGGTWKAAVAELKPSDPRTDNASYRAFTSELTSGPYRNTVLIRNLKALTTTPLFPPPVKAYEALAPAPAAASDPTGNGSDGPFRHGDRVGLREVALAIDCLDSSDGLPEVLRALKEWGFRATFFVNGEFLRRNPQAAQEIAASGYETANLFHIPLDLTAPDFLIDAAFVRQGLARQEDDWFAVTGKELGLLWHAPGWVERPALIAGAQSASYRTVGTDLPLTLSADRRTDVPELIEALLQGKKPGSILPLTLGLKDSTTGESFFTRWDLLLGGLADAGYRGVSVSQLMDHSRP